MIRQDEEDTAKRQLREILFGQGLAAWEKRSSLYEMEVNFARIENFDNMQIKHMIEALVMFQISFQQLNKEQDRFILKVPSEHFLSKIAPKITEYKKPQPNTPVVAEETVSIFTQWLQSNIKCWRHEAGSMILVCPADAGQQFAIQTALFRLGAQPKITREGSNIKVAISPSEHSRAFSPQATIAL